MTFDCIKSILNNVSLKIGSKQLFEIRPFSSLVESGLRFLFRAWVESEIFGSFVRLVNHLVDMIMPANA